MLTGLKIFTSILNSEFAVNFRWKCHNTSNAYSYSDLWFTVNHNILPVSNCHLFSDINISQGNVATRLRCGGIFSYHFTTNLSLSLTIKEFWKSVKIWQSYRHEFGGPVFWNTVYIHFRGFLPRNGVCHLQNSLCVQVLRSPILASLLHGTRVVGISRSMRRWANDATYIRQVGHHVGHSSSISNRYGYVSIGDVRGDTTLVLYANVRCPSWFLTVTVTISIAAKIRKKKAIAPLTTYKWLGLHILMKIGTGIAKLPTDKATIIR